MSSQLRWLVFVLIFVGGVVLGFVGSILIPHLGLAAVYERVGGWTLLGRVTVALLLLAIPLGYIVWLVAGAVQFATSADRAEAEAPLHYLQRGERTEIERVLVSTGGGPHAAFGLHLAAKIARAGHGSLTLFRVTAPTEEVDREAELQVLDELAERVIGRETPVETRVKRDPSVVDAILEETRQGGYDLLIVGASDEGMVRRLLFSSIPDAVAERTPCPVLIVRAAGSPRPSER